MSGRSLSQQTSDKAPASMTTVCRPFVECTSTECMDWYKDAINTISEGANRAWSRDEAANAFTKISVPLAYYDFAAEDYLESCQFFNPTFPAQTGQTYKGPDCRGHWQVRTSPAQEKPELLNGGLQAPRNPGRYEVYHDPLADLTQPKPKANEA